MLLLACSLLYSWPAYGRLPKGPTGIGGLPPEAAPSLLVVTLVACIWPSGRESPTLARCALLPVPCGIQYTMIHTVYDDPDAAPGRLPVI